MVNLKDHFIEKAQNEEEFKKSLKGILKFIQKGDEEFMTKSILAIRDIIKDENVDSKPKYFLLQIINLGCQMHIKAYYNILADKFLERLYLFACFDKKNPNFEQRGRNLLKDINPDSDEEYSLRFYQLLIEMFGQWGEDDLASSLEDYYSKYKLLKKAGIEFPKRPKYLFAYSENLNDTKVSGQQQHGSTKNGEQKATKAQELITPEELKERLQELKNMRMLIQDHLENNKETTYLFDDYFQLIEDQLAYVERFSGNLSSNREYQINKKYLSIYKENKSNYKEIRRLLFGVDEETILNGGKSNPFKNTSFEDQGDGLNANNQMDFKKKSPTNVFGDVVSNKSVNIQQEKPKGEAQRDTKKRDVKEERNEDVEKDETEELLLEFLKSERNHLVNKIKEAERLASSLKSENDRFQKKIHDQEITIKSLESKLEIADKENQHYKKTVDTFIRELSIKMKADAIKGRNNAPPLRANTYNLDRPSGLGLNYSSKLDFDIGVEPKLERPLSSFDHRTSAVDHNRNDPSMLQRPRSRLTEYNKTGYKADYAIEERQNRSMTDSKPMNFLSSTADAFYGRERQTEDLTDLKNRLNGTNDFLKGFNQDIDKILNKERGGLSQSAYNPSKRANVSISERETKPLYGNDSGYYNMSYKPGELNVYKREGLGKPLGDPSNPLDAYVSKYSRRDDDVGPSRTLSQNSRLDTTKDQFMDSLGDSKPLGGILRFKNN